MATESDLAVEKGPQAPVSSAPPAIAPVAEDPHAFLRGGGEMGERTRGLDWSKSAVGPVEGWPQNLKTAVGICLGSRYPIVIWWGKTTLTTFYNDAYIPILGVTKHPGWLGRSGKECWSEIWNVIDPMLEGVFATGEATWSEDFLLVLHRNLPREEGYFTFSYSPIREDSGAVEGIFCACTETTGRVIGERRLRTLRDLGRTVMAAKAVDEACEITAHTLAANPADIPFALVYLLEPDAGHARLVATTGLQAGSAAAPKRLDLNAPESPGSETWPLRRVFETGAPELVSDLPARFPPLPGGPWPESPETALVLPIAAPNQARPTGFLVAGLSPRRVMDADYRSFFDLIAGHVATAVANARSYEEERKRAEALSEIDRAKTVFFSNVSHEFRTPLTLMLGPIEEMLARSDAELPPAAKGQLEVVNRNGMRLLRLVNTLLDFSRIEAGRVRAQYQPTNLAALTADLASVFRAAVERAGLRLRVDCPQLSQPVYVDREMWEKIVLNLLSNALKFTFEGEIAVSLHQIRETVELRVQDTGTGIPESEIPRLFERFHRVQSARGRTHEGSGIGLAFVHELVKLHGGTIAAESVVDQGTRFTLSVPLGCAHLPAEQIGNDGAPAPTATNAGPYVEEAMRWLPAAAGPDAAQIESVGLEAERRVARPDKVLDRPRVLVADDNADMRQYIVRLLADAYEVEAVPDGAAALAAARQRLPDLILTDVMMPRLDGYGLLRELRGDSRTSGTPVILLSARAGEESRVEGMQAGADDYLVKPFSSRELLARVSAHIQMSRLRSSVSEALRESNSRFEALFNEAPIGIYLVDGQMRIRQVNPKARPVFGDIEGLIGSDFVEVMHRLWPRAYAEEIVRRFKHTLATGESHHEAERIEERLDLKVVEYYEWQIHRLPLPEGQFGVVCYFNDISRHILARQALAEADRRKNEFLAILAHELRNPLAPLRNGLQVMKLARSDFALVDQARTMMERQLTQMVRLIDDLLDISRISQGKVTLRKERLDLDTVVRHAVETSRPLIESRGLALDLHLPPHKILVEADMTRLSQTIANLLNNAAKYTDQGGHVTLSVQRQGRDAVVSVRDTGIGIPRHMLPKVFEMFTQVDRSSERSQGGLGIGLSLVKRLVEMHGGTVEARSEGHGMGSEFVIRLPVLSVAGTQRTEDREESVEAPGRRRVLVVDDNRDAALSLAMMLEMMGNETQTAYDGLEAFEMAREFHPDVMLLDIGMPKMNGHETAARIRQQPWGREIVLVAMTGWGQDDDKRKSHEAGFNFHMVKPVDPSDIEKLLAGLNTGTA